jgi:hypothetical protein
MAELTLKPAPEARNELAQAGRPGWYKRQSSPSGATPSTRLLNNSRNVPPLRGSTFYIDLPRAYALG